MMNFRNIKQALLGTDSESDSHHTSEASVDDLTVSDLTVSERSLKQKELLGEQAIAKLQAIAADLVAARRTYKEKERTVGERIAEGLDATVENEELSRVGDRVRGLESAMAVAAEKELAAQCAITDEKHQIAIEADEKLVLAFFRAVRDMQTLLDGEMKLRADELAAALMALQKGCEGNSEVIQQIKRLLGYYPTFLFRANAALIIEGRRWIDDIDVRGRTFSIEASTVWSAMTSRIRSR